MCLLEIIFFWEYISVAYEVIIKKEKKKRNTHTHTHNPYRIPNPWDFEYFPSDSACMIVY